MIPECLANVSGLLEYHPGSYRGVYFLLQDNEVVYVGQSVNVYARIQTHYAQKQKEFNKVFVKFLPETEDLDSVELEFINLLKPKYNWQSKPRTERTLIPWKKKMIAISDKLLEMGEYTIEQYNRSITHINSQN